MNSSPIIITGMHRSGTSLFASLLGEAGLMIGKDLDQNYESDFFYKINEKMLEMSGSSWDQPKTFTNLNQSLQNDLLNVVEHNMTRKGSIRYLGLTNWVITRSNIARLSKPWGWKDPRNTITWPTWKARFPSAKFIHVVRNPIDVAISIYKRERINKEVENDRQNSRTRKYSERMQNLTSGLELWSEYEDEAENMISFNPLDVIVVKYEDLLLQPLRELETIFDFLEQKKLNVKKVNIDKIDKRKAYAFLNYPEYKEQYESMKSKKHLRRNGYDNLLR